jgi:hypothetical protein
MGRRVSSTRTDEDWASDVGYSHLIGEFIPRKMRMSHVYQPLLIKTLVAAGGTATRHRLLDGGRVPKVVSCRDVTPGRCEAGRGWVERYTSNVVGLVIVFGMVVWGGVTLLLDAWHRVRRYSRPELADRLGPFQPSPLADEAEEWLQRQ